MAHILEPRPQFAESFGKGFGSTIGEALNALAHNKIQSLFPNQFVESAEQAGFPKEIANFLQHLSPQERTSFFQKLQPGDFGPGQQSPLAGSNSNEIIQSPQQMQPPQQQQLGSVLDKLNPMVSPQEQFMRDIIALQKNQQQRQQQPAIPLIQQPGAQPTQQQPSQQQAARKPLTIADVLSRPSLHEQAADKRVDKRLEHAEKLANRKSTQKFREAVSQEARDARDTEKVLKRGISIVEQGKNRPALANELLKKFDLDLQALKNGETTELEKLARWHMRGARSLFGGKVSNYELQSLLASVPNELQSPEGYKAIANRMLVDVESKILRFDTMRDIIKENGGEAPYDLESQVQERIEPRERELADKFIRGETLFTTKQEPPPTIEKLSKENAKEYEGAEYKDSKGNIYISDGVTWKKK